MKVSLNIHYRDLRTKLFKRILSHVNPDCDNQTLLNFVNNLNSLTTNEVVEVIKVVNAYLDEDIYNSFSQDDIDFIFAGDNFLYINFTAEDVLFIFSGDNFAYENFSRPDVVFVFD